MRKNVHIQTQGIEDNGHVIKQTWQRSTSEEEMVQSVDCLEVLACVGDQWVIRQRESRARIVLNIEQEVMKLQIFNHHNEEWQ